MAGYVNMQNRSGEFKIFMKIPETQLFLICLDSLMCSLYTLSGSHEVFKKINLKNDLRLDLENIEYFSNFNKVENFYELEKIFNDSLVKLFAFYLLAPFLNLDKFFNGKSRSINKEITTETTLLKKYLRRFKKNYKRYFSYQNGTYITSPTNKELNMYAIESLFLLLGI